MKIGFVRVFVTDFKKSLGFYTNKLGLDLDYSDESGWAQFKSGEDVSLAIESCAADRVEFTGKPEKQPWGGTLVNLKDPDGNVLTLMESAD